MFWGWAQQNQRCPNRRRALPGAGGSRRIPDRVDRTQACEPRGRTALSELVAVSDEDGDRLSADELVSTSVLLLIAGHDTSVHLIANAGLRMLTSPDQLAALRADLSLVDNVVEEVLRFESPVNILPTRFAGSAFELAYVTIPESETGLLSVLSTNRDASVFPDPDRFDIT
ncbi:cytochrome P450 [Amycolatopsis sp. NPDC051373]|uniref:cytochrome P450 n=1 Tax=Amycolatopsis sp. NPDC051373 TaxID=3155801 RepID=UPI00344F1AE0